MVAKKPKPCKQQGLCPFYGMCKFNHDANKCRAASDHNDGIVDEIS